MGDIFSPVIYLTKIGQSAGFRLVFAPGPVTSSTEEYHVLKSGYLVIRPDSWNLQVLQFLANCAWNSEMFDLKIL